MFQINDIVVFRENHKWVGCIGFVNEIKKVKDKDGKDTLRLMIGVPAPMEGVAYIFATPEDVENLQCAFPYPYEIRSKEEE
ncbi:MAG: hypothetical protein IJ880_02895 [Bacilli bacterium]|nr:hypothetical protein [Bacilli bacterium]